MGREVERLPALLLYAVSMGKTFNKTAPSEPDMDDYRAESDHRTMMQAAEIRGDHKRMAGVKRHHGKQRAALGRVGRTLGGRR